MEKRHGIDEKLFKEIAVGVERQWGMGGLSDGMYYDYALEIARYYFRIHQVAQEKFYTVGEIPDIPEFEGGC